MLDYWDVFFLTNCLICLFADGDCQTTERYHRPGVALSVARGEIRWSADS